MGGLIAAVSLFEYENRLDLEECVKVCSLIVDWLGMHRL